MTDSVDRLLELLDLERVGTDRFRVANADRGFGNRVFGGQVAAQAIRAVVATVDPDRSPHSLHAYFIRPGRPGVPIELEVERTRDGRSFTTRRVLASQKDEVIFEMSTSLHVTEPGVDYQMPLWRDVPAPESLPDRVSFIPDEARDWLPVELREVGPTEADEDGWYASTRGSG